MSSGVTPIRCPAGEALSTATDGPACRCRVAHDTITERENPSSLKLFCADDGVPPGYQRCPIWRQHRDAEHKGKAKELQRQINRSAHDLPKQPVAM